MLCFKVHKFAIRLVLLVLPLTAKTVSLAQINIFSIHRAYVNSAQFLIAISVYKILLVQLAIKTTIFSNLLINCVYFVTD
jgi:hypothetical protein